MHLKMADRQTSIFAALALTMTDLVDFLAHGRPDCAEAAVRGPEAVHRYVLMLENTSGCVDRHHAAPPRHLVPPYACAPVYVTYDGRHPYRLISLVEMAIFVLSPLEFTQKTQSPAQPITLPKFE